MNQPDMNLEELFVQLAIRTIRLHAIERKVQIVRVRFVQTNKTASKPAVGLIRTMSYSKISMRIAAVLLILISSATVYKYVVVNCLSFYGRQFVGYELGTARLKKT